MLEKRKVSAMSKDAIHAARPPYRIFEHTADLGMEVYGIDERDLFQNAAAAVFDIMTDVNLVRARKEKKIGHPLDASVRLGLSSELMDKLMPYRDQLRTILIVSSVDLVEIDQMDGGYVTETVPGLKVMVSASTDTKCERCWIHDPTVGQNSEHPTICRKCVNALSEMEENKD